MLTFRDERVGRYWQGSSWMVNTDTVGYGWVNTGRVCHGWVNTGRVGNDYIEGRKIGK